MVIGLTLVLIYAGGAIALGLIALIYTVWTKSHARACRERGRRIRRMLEGAP